MEVDKTYKKAIINGQYQPKYGAIVQLCQWQGCY